MNLKTWAYQGRQGNRQLSGTILARSARLAQARLMARGFRQVKLEEKGSSHLGVLPKGRLALVAIATLALLWMAYDFLRTPRVSSPNSSTSRLEVRLSIDVPADFPAEKILQISFPEVPLKVSHPARDFQREPTLRLSLRKPRQAVTYCEISSEAKNERVKLTGDPLIGRVRLPLP